MSLFAELKRRNVIRVAGAYLALGWIVTQITATVAPMMNLPLWIAPVVVWIGAIGFPFVLLFSWVYELTPEGLKRESEVDHGTSITHVTARRLDYVTIGIVALGVLLFAFDRLSPNRSVPVGAGLPANSSEPAEFAGKPAPTALPDDRSIAVLPFIDMSAAKDQDYMSDGIAEELLNLLAKIPGLKVTSRSSAFAFKGEKIDIAEVARKLNVAHVLEGSVRTSGKRVRITAQLIDARADQHLWSESYDRDLEDIFAVQDEIAGAVVEQLKIKLLGAAPTARKADPRAYALVLQARQLSGQRTSEGIRRSIALIEQALAIDPAYAAAWVAQAQNYSLQANNGERPVEEAYRLAREAVDRALAIDPDFAPAHATLGTIALVYGGDLAAAAGHIERALALDPANTEIIRPAGSLAQSLARLDLAIELGEYVVARDPVDSSGYVGLGNSLFYAGRFDESLAAYRTALSLSPARIVTHYSIGTALLLKGEADAALAEMLQEPDESWRLFGLAMVHHTLGRKAESDAALAQTIAKYEHDSAYNIAYVLAWRGETDRAFEWLDNAVAYKDGGLTSVAIAPLFARLNDDPRWLPFLRRIGRAPEQLAAIPFDVKLPQ